MTDSTHPIPRPSGFSAGRILLPGVLLCLAAYSASAARHDFSFADDRITCTVSAPESDAIPEALLVAVPLAMKTAIQEVGLPESAAHLSIVLKPPPSIWERLQGLFRPEVFAIQEGDELRLQTVPDPLKLTFRVAHEASHWLVARQFRARPPLWLDEGLAQAVGGTAAAAAARVHSQQLQRPRPDDLEEDPYSLEELTALRNYPKNKTQVAAFYWQAEALTQAIRKRLGKEAFAEYLALLSTPSPPDWKDPLKTRWYFNDGDMAWLARQITPGGGTDTP